MKQRPLSPSAFKPRKRYKHGAQERPPSTRKRLRPSPGQYPPRAGCHAYETRIEEWLDTENTPLDVVAAYDLYCAAHGEGMGTYRAERYGEELQVTGPSAVILVLPDEPAQRLFLSYIDGFKPSGHDETTWDEIYALYQSGAL